MPILPAEPDLFPPDLWERVSVADEPGDEGPRWWCLHTRPRQEKAAARHLRSLDYAYYLPQAIEESRTPAGRRLRSVIPLFAGYLFFHGDGRQRVETLRGNHVSRVIPVPDQPALVRDLAQIRRLLASGFLVAPDPTYPVGAWFRITTGPLEGLVGVIARRQGRRDRFSAVVRFLGRSVSVELSDWMVEPVAASGPAGVPGCTVPTAVARA